ncbi:MAG: fibronectin type III domain-containing protein, partial [Candidatus Paceibacterota bacterium]
MKIPAKITLLLFILVLPIIFVFSGKIFPEIAKAACSVGICNNGPSNTDSGGCGNGIACNEGNPWKQYIRIEWCNKDNACCFNIYGDLCSTGDKCIPGEKGLRAGDCNCGTFSPSIYKACCSGSTPFSCIKSANFFQDNFSPDEGQCPENAPETEYGVTSCPASASCTSCQYKSGNACFNNCPGTDTSCGCTSGSCINCNILDGWYNSGSTYYGCDGNNRCTYQNQEYRNYSCSETSCTYSVTNTQTLKSGCAYNASCVAGSNECSSGQTRCTLGTNSLQTCSNCDTDPFLEWCDSLWCDYGCSSGNVCKSAPAPSQSGLFVGNLFHVLEPNYCDAEIVCDWEYGAECSQFVQGDTVYILHRVGSCNPVPGSSLYLYKWNGSSWSLWGTGGPCNWGSGYVWWPWDGLDAGRYKAYFAGQEKQFTIMGPPSVNTKNASSIEKTSAQLTGNITDTGGANPTQRILEWGTSAGNYTSSQDLGAGGTGAFSYTLTNLSPNTTYYFRARAYNQSGWGYGGTNLFTTLKNITVPSVTTNSASLVGTSTAQLNGNVTSANNGNIDQKDFEWGTST